MSAAAPSTPKSLIRSLPPRVLKATIEAHTRYLQGRPGGTRANLSYVDLDNVNLEGVDLSEADLTGVHLSGALLSRAVLARATLSPIIWVARAITVASSTRVARKVGGMASPRRAQR